MKRIGITGASSCGLLALALALSPPAAAQSAGASEPWQFELTPYLWAAGLKGDVQVGTLPKTHLDMSFSDILDTLDFAAMGAGEVRKGRWGLRFDAIYMKVSDSATATRTGPGPIGASLTATAEAEVKVTILEAGVAYRVAEGRIPVDLIAGARYVKGKAKADIEASLFGPLGAGISRTIPRNGEKDWVDPIVGVRVQYPLADRWTLIGYADVGGFGVGSDFTWQVTAGVNYDYSKRTSFKLGYRHLSFDYDKGNTLFDLRLDGVYLGVGFRF